MRGFRFFTFAIALCFASACSQKPDMVALHRAAVTLHVLLQNGFEPESLAHAASQLHVEFEIVKASLPEDAAKKCDRAASMSDSLRRIFPALASGNPDELSRIRPELENLGLVKKQSDWDDFQYHLDQTRSTGLDTPTMTAEREQLVGTLAKWTLSRARNAALDAAKTCEQAT